LDKKKKIGFDISEIAFINWNAGGTSSISGLIKVNFPVYNDDNYNWTNELIMRYGLNKQDVELRKTEDAFQFNSTLGYRKELFPTGIILLKRH
jgi:hypothetical protein